MVGCILKCKRKIKIKDEMVAYQDMWLSAITVGQIYNNY